MKKPTRKQVLAAAAVLAALLIALGLWHFRADAQVARVKALQQELARGAAEKMDPAERRRKWEELNRAQRALSPAQRQQIFAEFRKQRRAELDRYSRMSKAEKTRWLDQQINRMEKRRRSRPAGGAVGGPPGQAGPGRANLSADDRETRRKQRLDDTTPEERAQLDQLRTDMAARRAQRGLPPLPGGFGRR